MSHAPEPARTLRIRAEEVKRRMEQGEEIISLDARSDQSWNASEVKVQGAVRIRPLLPQVDPAWHPQQLIMIYCT